MQDSSAFQYLAIVTIHESTTNPRQTFEQGKSEELADYVSGHIIRQFPQRIILEDAARGYQSSRSDGMKLEILHEHIQRVGQNKTAATSGCIALERGHDQTARGIPSSTAEPLQ